MTEESTAKLQLENTNEAVLLFGISDRHLKLLEDAYGVHIITRGETIQASGEEEAAERVIMVMAKLLDLVRKGIHISGRDVLYAVELERKGHLDYFTILYEEEISRNAKGKAIRIKTLGQLDYIKAIRHHDLVFGIGPAGTGKTYLAVVMAVNALKSGQVKRIILTRPAVEAGESLGFLPGDLKE
ncbi:hypothetical protein BpJC7_08950 [Weizmannia acidilactici]|uniref:PhoH-like protein n=2 Tax=Weizmannia acidilactici TaxID=2607726 RepID=A0A5J4J3L9_9BACI|nr:hypothetical protein BpJC7_08950 [Weizmannia acidilactici]